MVPSLVAVGTYSLLLAWNEYLYAFLLLSNDKDVTLAVALGNFLAADDSPWELLMATGLVYAAPPAAIYYAFKRYMVVGPHGRRREELPPAWHPSRSSNIQKAYGKVKVIHGIEFDIARRRVRRAGRAPAAAARARCCACWPGWRRSPAARS
jgi:hypothetical protein